MSRTHFALHPAQFKLDGGAMFGIIPKPLWEKKTSPDQLNRVDLALRLWLIRDESQKRVVLVDTGVSFDQDTTFQERFALSRGGDFLREALLEIDLTPEDITDLVITHLHFDHAGGLGYLEGEELSPTFPKATHHLHRDHYQYALRPTLRDQGSFHSHLFRPVIEKLEQSHQIHWHQGEEGVLIDDLEFRFKCSHGHTPFLMHPYNDQFIYLADLIPTSHHIHIPWVMGYDIYPGQTVKDKKQFLDFAMSKNLALIFEHDPKYWGGKVQVSNGKFCPKELFPAERSSFQELSKASS